MRGDGRGHGGGGLADRVPGARGGDDETRRCPERGIDISAYQNANGPIDWRELARHGIKFVAIKASEDTYYTNPYYLPDARAASRAGLAVLAYTFANPDRAGGAATASFAVRAAHYRRGHGALPLVVDLENDPYSRSDCYWFGQGRMIAWIAGFAARAKALTGSWPIIYTTAAWWRECTGSTGRFTRDPLWLADYDGGRPASLAVARWSFWQYSEDGLPARDRLDRPRLLPVGQRAPVAAPGLGAEAARPRQAPVEAQAKAQEAEAAETQAQAEAREAQAEAENAPEAHAETEAQNETQAKTEEAVQAASERPSIYRLQIINSARIPTRAVDRLRR